ncbi:Uncharacterized protein dnm_044340 [Desulfonema magnum]|uniref:Uncharacterized protein n=1 Tax=Desulfonema magnum TaxID=45655 RepID=A0A975BNR9_9BACT|nr:Uncharacterized protein dnm_044340 [Desulfonema magnum]
MTWFGQTTCHSCFRRNDRLFCRIVLKKLDYNGFGGGPRI